MGVELPPLELQVELVYPDGTTTRWDRDDPEAKDRPGGITFRTQRYTGFADCQLTLNREIDLEYPDLGLLEGLNLVGHDGSVAYEGRIANLPRSLQTTPQITVMAQGWMSHAKDQTFVECYVDRDLSKWGQASAARTVAPLIENYFYPGSINVHPDESGVPGVELAFEATWLAPYKPLVEAWWLPRPGITIKYLYYNFDYHNAKTMSAADTNWSVSAALLLNDRVEGIDTSGNLWPAPKGNGYVTATATRHAAFLQLYYSKTPAGNAGEQYAVRFTELAVYGNHGVPGTPEEPGGFYASQMIANIAERFAPKLDVSGVQATTFAIKHQVFYEETFPYDAFQTLNTHHRWELAVYEDRKLLYYPIDLTDYDWEIRLSDPGTTADLQGDDTANLCNGVIVRYTDVDVGYEKRLHPTEHAELRDENPANPANLNGDTLYTTLSLSVPATEGSALQIGRIYLAEFNQAKSPGTLNIIGHIRDRAGHWQQGWKVRAGDRLIISDIPNDSVRVVGETTWNHDTKTLNIAVDSSFKRLDAILARLGLAVEASNLSLP